MPKFSVVIPAYNSGKYLSEAIESVLSQTFQDWELLIVDDGSTDNTKNIIEGYTKRYPQKVKYFYQKNAGTSAARNRGIKAAKGEWIAFLDADDIWLSGKLELHMACFSECPEADLFYTNATMVKYDKSRKWPYIHEKEFNFKPSEMYVRILIRNFIPFSSVVVQKSVLEAVGGFDEAIRFCEDTDLLLRLAKKCVFRYINSIQMIYRVSPGSKNTQLENRYRAIIRYLNTYFDPKSIVSGKIRRAITRRLAASHYKLGYILYEGNQFQEARSNFQKSLLIWPFVSIKQFLLFALLLSPKDWIKSLQSAKRKLMTVK